MLVTPLRRGLAALALLGMVLTGTAAGAQPDTADRTARAVEGFPEPTVHSQVAYMPELRLHGALDACRRPPAQGDVRPRRRPAAELDAGGAHAADRAHRLPGHERRTRVGVGLLAADRRAPPNQYSYKGWEVIFSLVADRNLGFDDRHTYAKLGYFFRKAGIPADQRPENGGWTYGGLVFPEGVSGEIFEDQSFSHQTEWSGSTRIFKGGKVKVFYTAVAFYRNADGEDVKPADARIAMSPGKLNANEQRCAVHRLQQAPRAAASPTASAYQNGAQNPYYNFRDPFTFKDPANPGKTYMVFEGNTATVRGTRDVHGGGPRLPARRPARRGPGDRAQQQRPASRWPTSASPSPPATT